MTRAVFLLVLLLPITGCDKLPFASEPPTLTGTWSGTSTGGGNSALWTLHITDTNGELTGQLLDQQSGTRLDFSHRQR